MPLTRESIVATALAIVEKEGLEALSFRRVAGALGTGQASLYRHVADRSELVGLLVEELAGGFPIVDRPRLAPANRVSAQWLATHQYLAEHRWFVSVLGEGEYVTEASVLVAAHCQRQLADLGLSPAVAQRTYAALWQLVVGSLASTYPFGADDEAVDEAAGDIEWSIQTVLKGAQGAGKRR